MQLNCYIQDLRTIGANYYPSTNSCTFTVWAPFANKLELQLTSPVQSTHFPVKDESGYWNITLNDIQPGTRYQYKLDDSMIRADPASYYQPEGVEGPSEVIDHAFEWDDGNWKGIRPNDMIIYEIHTGTFTQEGTFEQIQTKIPYLKELGINTIELMPVGQFPGQRNWGYDGVFPFAVQNSYGGPAQLKSLVNACHQNGIAVIMDVVYNHLGPEGNYLHNFGPYFTSKYHTPWGKAINFDDAYCDPVRNYFLQNALMWLRDYHIDGLRLDAVHSIWDFGGHHIMAELKELTHSYSNISGKPYPLIAESNLNDSTYIDSPQKGGYGLDAQWLDEFHHSLHALITNERGGYYADFGEIRHLAKALRESYVNNGTYSHFRKKTFGNDAVDNPGEQFVIYTQNHDEIGNRMQGERLSQLVNFETVKLAALTMFISPYIPLLFMGEEYGETNPFLYFVDHKDPALIDQVRKGRKREFRSFGYTQDPPDPKSRETFNQSRLSWSFQNSPQKRATFNLYQQLIGLKKEHPVISLCHKDHIDITELPAHSLLLIEKWEKSGKILVILSFKKTIQEYKLDSISDICWKKLLDTSSIQFNGPGSLAPEMVCKNDTIQIQPFSGLIFEA